MLPFKPHWPASPMGLRLARTGAGGFKPPFQAVSKPHPSEAQTPEIVIPAEAGIQEGWSGETPL